jgi:hypothetical protein
VAESRKVHTVHHAFLLENDKPQNNVKNSAIVVIGENTPLLKA